MKTKLHPLLILLACFVVVPQAIAQGTAFNYQGRLNDSGNPANGKYDFIFQIFDNASAGNSIGGSVATNSVPVTDGLFTVALDFGATPFTGPARWLQIQVSTNGAGNYSILLPRQPLTPLPYAVYASAAGSVPEGGITSLQLAGGAVGNVQLAANAVDSSKIAGGQVVKSLNGIKDDVTLIEGNNVTLNTVGNSLQISAASGDALSTNVARLSLVNSANTATAVPTISFGFLVNATLTSHGFGYLTAPNVVANDTTGLGAVLTAVVSNGVVASLTVQNPGHGYSIGTTLAIDPPPSNAFQTFSGMNVFTGINTMTNPGNSFSGNFTGNGGGLTNVSGALPWQMVSGTVQQARPNTGYIVINNSLVTITLPNAANIGDVVGISGTGVNGWKIAQNAGQSVLAKNLAGPMGVTWSPHDSNRSWWGVASSSDGSKLVATAPGGQIYTSTDSGVTWAPRESSRNWEWVASSSDGSKLVAAALGDMIYTSTNYGVTWTPHDSSRDWSGVASSSDGSKLVATVPNGQIYTSTDSGVNWSPHDSNRNWSLVASSSDGSKLVATVSGGGQIYTSTNYGVTWTPRDSNRNWIGVASSSDGSKLVAAENGGQIYTSTDSGASWTPRGSIRNWFGIASSSDGNRLLAVVQGGQIYTSADSGASWTPRDSIRNWAGVASSSDGNKLVAVVEGGQIYTSLQSSVNSTTAGLSGFLLGDQNAAVELQYLGNGQFLPISHEGIIQAF